MATSAVITAENLLKCGTKNVIMQSTKDTWMDTSNTLTTTTNNLLLTSPQSHTSNLIGKYLESSVIAKYDTILHSSPKTFTTNNLLDILSAKQNVALEKLNQDFTESCISKDAAPEISVKGNFESMDFTNDHIDMPSYEFPSLEVENTRDIKHDTFLSVADELLLRQSSKEKYEDHQKMLLVNEVSASLIGGVDFKNHDNKRRKRIVEIANSVAEFDPEFLLKVALYSRQELNIRTTSNFLLALASYHEKCRAFLRKYFCTAVRLPTDWIEVAELYTTLARDKDKKLGSLPTVLRRAMKEKFPDFDTYQLGKYKKDSSKKPKKRKATTKTAEAHAESENDDDDDDDEETFESKTFRLKYLIRMLHISNPAFHVMALIGKSYPENAEKFRTSRLEGTWEPEKAGKRMKLPIPQTWETQLSLKGNNSTTWEELIDSKKLPYMALLRNIRNILLADVSKGHHNQVLNRINNENAVIHSRQLPFRFLAAHEVVDEIKKRKSQGDQGSDEKKKAIPTSVSWKLLERYHTALDGAISIAAIHNLPAIAGKTVFFKNVGDEMDSACITARGLGQSRSMKSVADLLCEMCTKACESCREYTYNTELYGENSIAQIWYDVLTGMIYRKVKIDTLIVVTDADANIYFLQFVSLYRLLVNNRLLFVTISLNGSQPSVAADDELDVKLVGFSDNILRFIAQRGHSSLLSYIDNIDTKYKLKKSPSLAPTCEEFDSDDKTISPFIRQPRWRTVRVFISSTFVDMHGERDLLVRYVFPELRERARKLFIDLYEVDLRWGINEEESTNQKMVEICLKEVSKCQLFIGILGERYGSIPLSYQVNDDSGLEWLQDYPAGASITELEIQHAALANPTFAKTRAFFYLRDKTFIRDIPHEAAKLFTEQNEVPKRKLSELKSRIRKSGLEVFDKYPCEWSGSVNGKYVVSGLAKFGERIISNVWNAIQSLYNAADEDDDMDVNSGAPCASSELELQRAHVEKVNSSFIGRSEFVSDATSIIKSQSEGFILIAGRQGSGKTFLMTRLFSQLEDDKDFTHSVLPCFVNAMQHCGRALNILRYLCHQLKAVTKLKRGTKVDDMDAPALLNCYLNEISGRKICIVVFIDGIEMLNEVDQLLLLNSIPNPLPTGIVIVCSASVGTPLFKEITRKDHVHLKVKPLLIKERTQIARNILSLHGKTLNENAFNNQLTALTFKRECSLPIYIELACQILCEYAVFEDLDNKIESMDNTVTGLLLSCVDEARDEFGKDVTNAFLVLLFISPEGLTKDSMHCLMSLYMQLNNTEFDLNTVLHHLKQQSFILPRVLIERLVTVLKAFVCYNRKGDSEVFVTAINPHLFEQVLNTSCGSKSSVAKIRKQLFIIKSGMLISLADPFFDRSWKGKNAEALSLIPHHISESHSYQDLEDILCDFDFISAKIEMGLVSELLEDFQTAYRAKTRKFSSDQLMKEMGAFFAKNQHIFQKSPHLLLQTALNYEDDIIANMAEDVIEMKNCYGCEMSLYLKVHSPLQKSYCKQTLNCKKAIFCVEVCPDTENFAIGEDNVLKVYDSSNLKEIHSFYGHVDAITSVCYIGRDRLCSGSFDGELCLWDLVKDIRLATMSGHEKSVTGCLCDHTGLVIVSVSLDRTIRTWSARTGKHISTMNVSKSPINCLDLHPYSHLAVIGNWNKTIEIWDLLQCKYVSNIEYMSASVQSVKISPDAKYIVSSMLDGNISIWSFDMRIELITLQTSMPIRAIAFSKSGDLLAAGDDCAIKKWKFCFNDVQCHLKGNNNNQCTAVIVINYEKVAVGYADGFVDIFSCETNAVIKSVQVSNTPIRILCKHEEHDGIIVGAADYVRIMTVSSNKPVVVLQGSYDAMAVASSLDGDLIVTGNSSGLVFVYRYMDIINKNYLPQFCNLPAHEEGIVAIAYGVNENKYKFMTASTDNIVKLWTTPFHDKCNPRGLKRRDWGKEISPDKYQDEIIRTEHASKILSCNWINTDCGKSYLLILSYADGYIVALNGKSHKQQWSVFAHNAPVSHLYHCRFNNAILSFATDGSCKLWAYSGVELISVESNGASCIGAYAKAKTNCAEENHCVHGGLKVCRPSINGIVIGRATRNGEVSVERMGIKDMGTMVGHLDSIMSLSVGAADNIVTSALDGSVKMWNLVDTESSKQQFIHVGEITNVTFNSRFGILLTTDSNGDALIWKHLESWTPVVKFKAHESAVKCACFLGPTWHFITGSLVGMKVWKYEGPLNSGQLDEEEVNVKFISDYFLPVLCCDYNVGSRGTFVGTSSGDIWAFDIKINEKDPSGRDWVNRHCPIYSNNSSNPCSCIVSIKCVKGLNYIIYVTVSGILGVGKIVEKNTIEQYLQIDLQEDPTFNIKNCVPTALTILPHSKSYRYFAVGFSDGSVMYASFTSKKSSDKSDKLELNKIATHVDGVNGLSYASEMQQLWTGGRDGKIKVWSNDCQARSLIQVAEHQCKAPITCMDFGEDTAFAGDILGNVYLITPLN